jgi:hypothetical protein
VRKRNLVAVVLAAGMGLAPAVVPAAHAEGDSAATIGRFTTPFREDRATYNAADNTFTGTPRGDTGCLPADDKGHHDCLPAGASENVLADGRVLYWNAIEGSEDLDSPDEAVVPSGGDLARNDRSRVLSINWADPLSSSWLTPAHADGYFPAPGEPPLIPNTTNANPNPDNNSDGSLFCSDQKQLADGSILAAGGTNYYAEPRIDESHGVIELEGVRNARIFDPAANAWKPTGSLNYGRWYPSMVTLADGNIFIASGVTKLIKPIYPNKDPQRSGDNVPETETYNVQAGTWTDNGTSAQRSLPLFPRLHLLPNGHVYYDAAGQAFNPMGQSYKQALWNIAASYDPATKTWTDLGVPGLDHPTNGERNISEPGFRGSTFSQALPFHPGENGQYNKAAYLTAGGVTLMSPGSYIPTDSSRIDTVTTDGNKDTLVSMPAGPLGRRRWYSSGVTLPTGQVLAFSGADVDEVVSPGHESPIRQAELFTPVRDDDGAYVGGTWSDVAVANRRRTYHNNAVLLPDGRVLIGGHAPIPNTYYNVMNDPDNGVRTSSNNFKDASFELYEPPYLHWGVSRPVIGNMSARINYGQNLVIPTTDPGSVESVVLVKNPAETHLIDADQRVVELPITSRTGDALQVSVTSNKAVLPSGAYMLFLNKGTDKGMVPSVAKQVFVGVSAPAWTRNAPTYPKAAAMAVPPVAATGGSTAAPSVLGGLPVAATAQPVTKAVAKASPAGTPLSAKTVAADRASDRPRRSALVAVGAAALMAVMALAGTRRRRTAVRIEE